MKEEAVRRYIKDATHIVILLALLFLLLGILTWTGVMRCNQVPAWCGIYYAIMGEPKVLIVYSGSGLGDAFELQRAMADPQRLGVHAQVVNASNIGLGNLKEYQLVIVTNAKKLSTEQIKTFINYYLQGGRIVWTGDAGTELAEGDFYAYKDELQVGDKHEIIGPWARMDANNAVRLDYMLSAEFLSTYCEAKDCTGGSPWIGRLKKTPGKEHRLIEGLSPDFPLYGDLALVRQVQGDNTKTILTVDALGVIISKDGEDLGKEFPVIITSGLGERIAYYAIPLETLADRNQFHLLGKMYYGMIQ